jgi:amidase
MPLVHDTARAFMPYPDVPVLNASVGLLSGLSFAAKDLFDVAGYPTSGGQPLLLAHSGIKTDSANAVQRLLDAGARFVGKTITDEFAFSMNGNNAHFGVPINGADPDRISGGSSSGSAAAVSNRLVDFALGTDTGGSVRVPANHCGLYGIRPSHGRVSLKGCLDLSPSFDTCGWFTRDSETFARVADVLVGPDHKPLPQGLRLLTPTDVWGLLSNDVIEALTPAKQRIAEQWGSPTPVKALLDDFDSTYWSFRFIQGREAWNTNGPFIERYSPPLGPGVKERFAWARSVSDSQFNEAIRVRQHYKSHITQILAGDGVMVLPTMPNVAPLLKDSEDALEDYRNRAIRMLCISGLSGFPQVTLPLGNFQGAPLGISLLGPKGSDRSLISMVEVLSNGLIK